MATRTIIVPSTSGLVLLGLYGLINLTNSCSGDGYEARNAHPSSHVDNGGIIGDYDPAARAEPAAATAPSEAVKAAEKQNR